MAVYQRRDSPFWWMLLEHSGIRKSTGIPIGDKSSQKQSRAEAEAIYRAAMGDLARGQLQFRTPKPTIRFREWATWYLDHVVSQQRSRARGRSMIRGLIEAFGDLPLSQLTEHRIEEWKTARARQVQKATVNRELELLKPLLKKAIPKYLDINPAARVRRFRVPLPPITILSESAEDALLAHAQPAETALILLGLDALLRLGDARRLKAEHDRGDYLLIVDSKTGFYQVPVSSRLRAALDVLTPQGGFYFPRWYRPRNAPPEVTTHWTAMSAVTAHDLFRAACERANVPTGRKAGGVTFHALRHTGATRAARAVKLTVVQRLGGWKSLDMLTRYDHPDDAEIIRAVEAISARAVTTSGDRVSSESRAGHVIEGTPDRSDPLCATQTARPRRMALTSSKLR
jgi:integrase